MEMPVRPERQFPGVQTALHLAEALLEAKHEYGYILPPAERCALHGIITVASHTAAHQMAGRHTPAIFHDRLIAIREKLDRNAVQAGSAFCIAPNGADGITAGKTYPLLPDAAAKRLGLLRLMDDCGEPSLYPTELFDIIPATGMLERQPRSNP